MDYSLFDNSVKLGASDIHITEGSYIMARVNGYFINLNDKILTKDDTRKIATEIIGDENIKKVKEQGQVDLALTINENRFRVNAYNQKGGLALSIRVIPNKILSFEELGLPDILNTLINKKKGLILITGQTGSGKSTTLASIINKINATKQKHIITIEDPIEYIHKHKNSLINQKEVGVDTPSFDLALKSCLRQDPDIILIGEMRDKETIKNVLTAVETGHLVFSTLHTNSASKSIDRIVDVFSENEKSEIRYQLSTVIEAIISQQLINKKDEKGRVVATEVMIADDAIRNLIRENKTYQIQNVIQTSSNIGMKSMDQDLLNLYDEGLISKESLLSNCNNLEYIENRIRND